MQWQFLENCLPDESQATEGNPFRESALKFCTAKLMQMRALKSWGSLRGCPLGASPVYGSLRAKSRFRIGVRNDKYVENGILHQRGPILCSDLTGGISI